MLTSPLIITCFTRPSANLYHNVPLSNLPSVSGSSVAFHFWVGHETTAQVTHCSIWGWFVFGALGHITVLATGFARITTAIHRCSYRIRRFPSHKKKQFNAHFVSAGYKRHLRSECLDIYKPCKSRNIDLEERTPTPTMVASVNTSCIWPHHGFMSFLTAFAHTFRKYSYFVRAMRAPPIASPFHSILIR